MSYYYSYSFFLRSMNLSTADLRNYRTEFHVLAAILKMADILKILKMQNCSSNGDLSLCQILCLYPFFPRSMNLSTADLRNYRTEFHETWWSYRYMFLVDPKVFRFVSLCQMLCLYHYPVRSYQH
jgi:hypothetical protein